jgi:hypothetical protein
MSWGPFDLLRPLFDFLICLCKFFGGLLVYLLVGAFNVLVAGLAALLAPLLALLPNVSLAEWDPPDLLAWANWLFPLDQFVIATGIVLAVLGIWHVLAVGLRWLKVVE